jgi:hypothetical protein
MPAVFGLRKGPFLDSLQLSVIFIYFYLFVSVFYFWGARFKINYPQNPKNKKGTTPPDETNAHRISAYRDPGGSLEPITGAVRARPKRGE